MEVLLVYCTVQYYRNEFFG